MSIHKIKAIAEADYGCEEHADGPHAVLVFEDGDKLEVSEKWIAERVIKEGKDYKTASSLFFLVAIIITFFVYIYLICYNRNW